MWGIGPSLVLVLVPLFFVGIIPVAAPGFLDEQTRGDRISKFFGIAAGAVNFFTMTALPYQAIDSEEEANRDFSAEIFTI